MLQIFSKMGVICHFNKLVHMKLLSDDPPPIDDVSFGAWSSLILSFCACFLFS